MLLLLSGTLSVGEYVSRALGSKPESLKEVRFDDATPQTPKVKYGGAQMPRKHPSSVNMGRFLKDLNCQDSKVIKGQDLFVANEKDGNGSVTVVYHALTAQERYWDISFEEIRLEYYEEQAAKRSTQEGLHKTWGIDKGLPSWLSKRVFNDSIFGSSVSSETSPHVGAALLSALDSSASSASSAVPDLLTGSPLRRKSFT